jgi:hypothetical protein
MKHKRLYHFAVAVVLIVIAGGLSVLLGVFRNSSLTPDLKTAFRRCKCKRLSLVDRNWSAPPIVSAAILCRKVLWLQVVWL